MIMIRWRRILTFARPNSLSFSYGFVLQLCRVQKDFRNWPFSPAEDVKEGIERSFEKVANSFAARADRDLTEGQQFEEGYRPRSRGCHQCFGTPWVDV
jgi:hypothetical protein